MTDTDDTTAAEPGRNRRVLRRLGQMIAVVLLLVIIVPFVIYAVPQVAGADGSYVVLSGSMQPTMDPGDVVIVEDVPASEIEEGDIITFENGDQTTPTTHRVIEVIQRDDGVEFRTAGDNSESADSRPVSPAEIEGQVPTVAGYPFVIPWIGHVIQFASTQAGFALLIVIPIGLLILSEVWSMSRRMRSSRDESDATFEDVQTKTVEQTPQHGSGGDRADRSQPSHDGSIAIDHPRTHVDLAAASNGYGAPKSRASNVNNPEVAGRQVVTLKSETARDVFSAAEEPDDSAVSFTAPELELGLIVLLGFLAYSAWVAVETVEIWAFTVAGSVGAAFLLLSALYLSGRLGGETESEETLEIVVDRDEIDPTDLHTQLTEASTAAQALSTAVTIDRQVGSEVSPRPNRTELTADGGGRTREGVNDD